LDEEDNEFDKYLKESTTYQMPSQLRQLFASILLFVIQESLMLTNSYMITRKV